MRIRDRCMRSVGNFMLWVVQIMVVGVDVMKLGIVVWVYMDRGWEIGWIIVDWMG